MSIICWEKLKLDSETCEVSYDGDLIHLTPKEYQILELFLTHPRRVFSRSVILDRLWSMDKYPGEEAVTTQIKGLRQKLKAVGMSCDLIETVYGLGYRLRAAIAPEKAPSKLQGEIDKIWLSSQAELRGRVERIHEVVLDLEQGNLNLDNVIRAKVEAHRLAGTLGTFGLLDGSEIAREIELLLDGSRIIKEDLVDLVQRLDRVCSIKVDQAKIKPKKELLVINCELGLVGELIAMGDSKGWKIERVVDLNEVSNNLKRAVPDVILLGINSMNDGMNLINNVIQCYSLVPILLITEVINLSQQLSIAQSGVYRLLSQPITAQQILEVATRTIQELVVSEGRVMIVDDDPILLEMVMELLLPWGLEVVVLDDSLVFWDVLTSCSPDLLILDVEMPNFSGIDLCQVVRNDALWQHLPILFLSAHKDRDTIQRVFSMGADDYVGKPIIEAELIARVLNRLERSKLLRLVYDFKND